MTASNTLFLTVRPQPVLPGVGWQVRVLDPTDMTTVVAYVTDWIQLTISPQLNDAGTGSITMDADAPFWAGRLPDGQSRTQLLRREYLWEAWSEGVPRFQWLGESVEETLINDDLTRGITVSGPGIAAVLSWAKVYPPSYPNAPLDINSENLNWPWGTGTPAMQRWLTLLSAAQSRGAVPWVKPMFSAAADSGGAPWSDVTKPYVTPVPFAPDMGSDLITQLNLATGQDATQPNGTRADWVMWPGFHLDVRPVIGVRRDQQVIFYEGQLLPTHRTAVRDQITNAVVLRDDTGGTSIATDTSSVHTWGRRERFEQPGLANLRLTALRDQVVQLMLEMTAQEKDSWTLTVPPDDPGRTVFTDYGLGDWIGVSLLSYDKSTSTAGRYRVVAITVQVDAQQTTTVQLTLQTVLDYLQLQLQRQITALEYQVLNFNTDTTINVPDPGPIGPSGPGPGDGSGGTGTGGAGDCCGAVVYIQDTDPGTTARAGDFWYQP